jgi:hypothetical protein
VLHAVGLLRVAVGDRRAGRLEAFGGGAEAGDVAVDGLAHAGGQDRLAPPSCRRWAVRRCGVVWGWPMTREAASQQHAHGERGDVVARHAFCSSGSIAS